MSAGQVLQLKSPPTAAQLAACLKKCGFVLGTAAQLNAPPSPEAKAKALRLSQEAAALLRRFEGKR